MPTQSRWGRGPLRGVGSKARLAVVGVVALLAGAAMMLVASGQSVEVDEIVSATGYEQVTVTFSGPVTDEDGEDPGTGNFALVDADDPGTPEGIDIDDVQAGADDRTWVVTFASAVEPNDVALAFSDLYDAADEGQEAELSLPPEPVPMTAADLVALLGGFDDVALPLADLNGLPFAGEWLANLELREILVDDDLTEAAVSLPRTLDDFGLELPDLGPAPTQRDIEALFVDITGVDIDFGNRTAALEFTDQFNHEETLDIGTEVEEIPFLLEGELGFTVGLRDRLSLELADDTVRLAEETDVAVHAALTAADVALDARIGFVDVAAGDVDLSLDGEALLNLACEEPEESENGLEPEPDDPDLGLLCPDDQVFTSAPAVSGDASFAVGSLEVVAFEQELSFDHDPLLAATWDLAEDLAEPVSIEAGPFIDLGLHHFANADVSAVTLGLEWIASWLEAVTDFDAFAQELPLLDAATGEVAALAELALAEVEELEKKILAFMELVDEPPSAQELVQLLCDTGLLPVADDFACDDLDSLVGELDGFSIETDRIVYGFDIGVVFDFTDIADLGNGAEVEDFELPIDLELADAIPGLNLDDVPGFELRVSTGEWTSPEEHAGSRLSATIGFELGIDIRDAADLEDEWWPEGADPTELVGPGGVPFVSTPNAADLCNTLTANLGVSRSLLALENGWGTGDASVAEDCAAALLAGHTIALPDDGETRDLDDADLCAAAARVWLEDVEVDEETVITAVEAFRDLNGFADDPACAAGVRDAVDDDDEHLQYLESPPSPLRLAHRLFIGAGEGDLIDLSLVLEGTGIEAGVRAGILDLGVTGQVRVDPSFTVALAGGDFERDPARLDLVELARHADDGSLDEILSDVDASGSFAATLDFHNDVVAAQLGDIGLDVRGDLTGFFDDATGDAVRVEQRRLTDDDELGAGEVVLVGIQLGDWRSLQHLSASEVIDMIVGILEAVGDLAGEDVLAFEIPFIGTNLQDITGFARAAADTAEGIRERGPETLTGLERALRRGLAEAGLDESVAESVGVLTTGDELQLSFDLDHSIARQYPFSLPLQDWLSEGDVAGIPVGISPVDNGARVAASASMQWTPTIGIAFSGGSVAERVSFSGNPTLTAGLDAALGGDVFLGPMTVNIDGNASADPSVELTLVEAFGDGSRVTLADLADAPLPDLEDVVAVQGGFSASLDVGPVPSGGLAVNGQFHDLFLGDPANAVTVTTNLDFTAIQLDLRTLVQGTAQTARFVGRTMSASDTLTTGLPLIGDELNRIADVGRDLRTFADEVEVFWDAVEGDSEAFLAELTANLEDTACDALPCTVGVALLDGDGNIDEGATLGTAQGVRLTLDLAREVEQNLPLTGGLGFDAMNLDMDGDLSYRAGYRAGLVFEISITDGFTVAGVDEGLLFELYANVSAGEDAIDLGVNIGGIPIAGVRGGSISLTGGLGPAGDAAGFALTLAEPISLSGLADRRRDPERLLKPRLMLDADVTLPVVIGEGLGVLPTLVAPVYFAWEVDETFGGDTEVPEPTLMIGDPNRDLVHIDASELVHGLVKPLLEELDRYNPVSFEPIHKRLETEIDLIEKTPRELLEAIPATPDIELARTLFLFLVDLEAITNKIVDGEFDGRYNIGHANVLGTSGPAFHAAADPGDIGDLIDLFASLANLLPTPPGGSTQSSSQDSFEAMAASSGVQSTFGPISVPLLGEPLAILGLITGTTPASDVTFIEVDAGQHTLGLSIGFEQNLFDLDAGFIEGSLTVGLDGRLGLTMRLGFGYDARGITSGHPINGFYIVDPVNPHTGRKQQIVELGAGISAFVDGRFGISVIGIDVASARFKGYGGADLSAGLQLFTDSPAIPPERRNDGKFHLDDIMRVRNAHTLTSSAGDFGDVLDFLCMFKPGVEFNAFLGFNAKAKVAKITVWKTRWDSDWDGLEFRTSCAINPQAAQLLDGDLILNAGPDYAADRFDDNPNTAEEFVIGTDDSDNITVEWTGAGHEAFEVLTFDPDHVQRIVGQLGDHGGHVVVDDLDDLDDHDIPVILDGGDSGASVEVNTDARTDIRGFDTVMLNDGRNDVRSVRDGEVVVAGGDNLIDGSPGTTYRFVGDDWGVTDLDHRGDDAVLDFSGAGGPVHGDWSFGTIEVVAGGGTRGLLEIFDGSTVAEVIGSDNDGDLFEIAGDVPDGLLVDAGRGTGNEVFVDADGNTHRHVVVRGNPAGEETLTVEGSFANNSIVLRARPGESPGLGELDVTFDDLAEIPPASHGFVAMFNPARGDDSPIDRVDYDFNVTHLVVDGKSGSNQFALDDVATRTTIRGGDGAADGAGNDFQVGQVFGAWPSEEEETLPDGWESGDPWPDGDIDDPRQYRHGDNVVPGGEVRTRNVEGRGPMTLGVSHPTDIEGGAGDDMFTIYSSAAPDRGPAHDPEPGLQLHGISGNNTFLLRAFILEGGVGAVGGDGDDYFEYVEDYVQNGRLRIDGGTGGFNTLIAVGSELGDGFVLDGDRLFICVVPRTEIGAPGEFSSVPAPDAFAREELPFPDEDCAWEAEYENIDLVVGHGLAGDNVFWVRSVAEGTRMKLFGGEHGSDFYVGDLGLLAEGTPGGPIDDAEGHEIGGDVSGVQGRVALHGEGLPEFNVSVRDPIVLPGEDATPTSEPEFATVFGLENTLLVDARLQGTGEVGFMDADRVWGLGMPDQVDVPTPPDDHPIGDDMDTGLIDGAVLYGGMDEVSVLLGDGNDDFTIFSTSTFTREVDGEIEEIQSATHLDVGDGADEAAVRGIDGPTHVEAARGDNVVRVGSAAAPRQAAPDGQSTLAAIVDELTVAGGDVTDLQLDASGSDVAAGSPGDVVDVRQNLVTGLSMPGRVTHDGIDLLDIALTDGADVANVRGTSAATTRLQGLGSDDRFFVSDAADLGVDEDHVLREARADDPTVATPPYLSGQLTDLGGDVDIVAGGDDNLLMVSDLDGDGLSGTLDHDAITIDDLSTISYDATGTFARGITVWTGDGDDTMDVVGIRRDGDPTTLAWENREEGAVRTITTLNTGGGDDTVSVSIHDGGEGLREDGFFVLNTGPGDDTVLGADSTLGFVVFGGPGNDTITTGDGDDLAFGDEGRVEYGPDTLLGDDRTANVNDGSARAPTRLVSEPTDPSSPDAEGYNNRIDVGLGDDVAWGGLGNAFINADGGRNALVGDHAEVWRLPVTAEDTRTIATNDGFIDVTVNEGIAFRYVVDVFDELGGGDDTILGGDDGDAIFGGPGNDTIVGGDGDDIIFAGDGDDIVWGAEGDDRIYGGTGDNFINVKKPSFDGHITRTVHSDAWWDRAWSHAPEIEVATSPDRTNGSNIVYGGRGRDVLQPDTGGPGQEEGDRMMNWYGSFNLFLTCEGAYGAGWVLRQPNPQVEEALLQLAEADGAYQVRDSDSSGWRQLSLVTREHAAENRGAPHPDHPGNNVTCT